jgi:hypothetical protein
MPEQAAYKGCHFVLGDCQIDQAIAGMTEMTRIKVSLLLDSRVVGFEDSVH